MDNADNTPASDPWLDAIQSVSDWIVGQALREAKIPLLFEGLCQRLSALDMPIARGHLALPTLHPMFESQTVTWWRGGRAQVEQIPHARTESTAWLQSPLYHMLSKRLMTFRYRFEVDDPVDFPMFDDLRGQGITDYFAQVTPFRAGINIMHQRDGMITSWSTDRPGGFDDPEVAALERLQLRLGLAVKTALREQTAINVVSAYLGPDPGRRVLDGQIRLGDGETIHAVIWYNDLRDSTGMADRLPSSEFLAILNDYFACTAGAVLDHGGQVLRFIGDAVLSIFTVDGPGGETHAARAALAAARDAERRMAALNEERRRNSLPALGFGLGLHIGDVMYGNIGVPERVEFSVIGSVANEVCRIEGLTKSLQENIVVSEDFARCLPIAWRSLGRHRLRGVDGDMEVLAPPE